MKRRFSHLLGAVCAGGLWISASLSLAEGGGATKPDGAVMAKDPNRAEVIAYAKAVIIPEVKLENASIDDVMGVLSKPIEVPGKRRPAIVLAEGWTAEQRKTRRIEELRLRNVSLGVFLEYVSECLDSGWDYQDGKIVITPNIAHWGERKRCQCGTFLTDEKGVPYPGVH